MHFLTGKITKVIIAVSILIIALGVYLGLLIFSPTSNFDPDKVELKLGGKQSLNWGEENKYNLYITNKNNTRLQNVSLQTKSTKNLKVTAQRTTIGEINKDSKKSFKLNLRAFGAKDQNQKLQAKISYQVGSTETSFSKKVQKKIKTKNSPLKLSIVQKNKNSPGRNPQVKLFVKNKTNWGLPRVKIKLGQSQDPSPVHFIKTENPKKWSKSNLLPEATTTAELEMDIPENEELSFEALVKILSEQKNTLYEKPHSLSLSAPEAPVSISQKFLNKKRNSFTPGEKFILKSSFKNNSSTTLEKIKLSTELKGIDFIKMDSIELEGQAKFNHNTGRIIATSFSPLEPNAEAEYKFDFKTKDNIPIVDQNQEAQILLDTKMGAKLKESKAKVTDSNKKVLKIQTNLELYTKISHIAGPNPPTPEDESTYKITWRLLNSYNDISDLNVTTILPKGVSWKEDQNSNQIDYDQKERRVNWRVGKLAHGTGWLSPIKEASFKVTFKPKAEKRKYFLTGVTTAKGTDQFQEQQIKQFNSALTIENN